MHMIGTGRNLAFVGAGLLIFGLFCPVMTLPIAGGINFFVGANISAPALLALALIGGALALTGRERDAVWPGAAAAALLLFHFATLQAYLPQMRASVAELGIPGAAASTVQVEWGWLVLAFSSGLMIYAGERSRRAAQVPIFGAHDGPAKTINGAAVLIALGAMGWTLFPQ
jgi:hypothetical protein